MKKWYEYLWIVSITYLILGIFNILFGLIGIICFITPLFIAIFQHDKAYCNKYCGRSRLFDILGSKYKLSRNVNIPFELKDIAFEFDKELSTMTILRKLNII